MLAVEVRRIHGVVGVALLALIVAGCGSELPAITSGQIGCAEQDVQISDKQSGWSTTTWTADCRGKRFYCSSVSSGYGATRSDQITCRDAVSGGNSAPTASASPPATSANPPAALEQDAGCHYDTQCKADRLCVKGECVPPTSSPPAAPSGPSQPATNAP